MGKSLSKKRGPRSLEPAWDNPREVAQFLRANGFPDVPLRWGTLDPYAPNRKAPDPLGIEIAGSGEDLGLGADRAAQVAKRIRFANRYGPGLKATGIRPDKPHTEEGLIKAAKRISIPPNWFLIGSMLMTSQGQDFEDEERECSPEFIHHYVMLDVAAAFASSLSDAFGDEVPVPKRKTDVGHVHRAIVRDACLAVVSFAKGTLVHERTYQLRRGGVLALSRNAHKVRYFPFIIPMLQQQEKRQKEIYLEQEYELRINGEERTAILNGLALLGEKTGAMQGAGSDFYIRQRLGNAAHAAMLWRLHHKLLSLLGRTKPSPFEKKAKSGRPKKAKYGR